MAILVLLVLVALWGAFFLWPLVQRHTGGRKADSVRDFSYRLGVIGRTGGHRGTPRRIGSAPVRGPHAASAVGALAAGGTSIPAAFRASTAGRARTLRRRRDVLLALLVAVAVSLGLALTSAGLVFWVVQGVFDALLTGYVFALVGMRRAARERQAKVRFLVPLASAPSYALRRSGSS